jgi:hypothetical protein
MSQAREEGDTDREQRARGAAGASAAAPQRAPNLAQDRAQEELTIEVLRKLLESDLQAGIAAVDRVIASARGPSGARAVMRSMSLLAEVDDPVIKQTLYGYCRSDSKLVRLHAAKLLEQRGDRSPLMTVVADLVADLSSDDERRKLQALALLHLAGDSASAAKIAPLLRDDSSAVRRGAIFAMRGLDDGSLHAALTPLLQDPDPLVQQAAASALRSTP